MKNGKHVYLIDDDSSVRKALKRFLVSSGFQVDVFISAEDFLERIPIVSSGCLILDVRMPGLSGLELQDKLIALGLRFRMIFITAYANPHERQRVLEAGAVAYLTKPIDDKALIGALQEAECRP